METRYSRRASRHLRRAQELLGFGDATSHRHFPVKSTRLYGFGVLKHLEASSKIHADHCSTETLVQCFANCWLVAVMSLLIKLPGLYPLFPPEMKTWLEGVQKSMVADVPTCTNNDKVYPKLWSRFFELAPLFKGTDVSDIVCSEGPPATLMLRACLEQIQNVTVAFSTLDFEARLKLDQTTLKKIVEIANKNRKAFIQMITLDNFEYLYWYSLQTPDWRLHRERLGQKKPPVDERFMMMEDIEWYILNIEKVLREANLTLRGGSVQYNLSSEKGKTSESNHTVSFTICDKGTAPNMIICSWGECQKKVEFMRPDLGLILQINLIIYSVDEFYDASPHKHSKHKYYDASQAF